MLYDAILLGSRVFHTGEPLGWHYDSYFRDCPSPLLDDPEGLDIGRVHRVIEFVNQWRTHYQSSPEELLAGLRQVMPDLCALGNETCLRVELGRQCNDSETVGAVIERIFQTVATCGRRYESTGASKILHVIHPDLFVMWDNAIAAGYAAGHPDAGGYRKTAQDYACRFLPRVQLVIRLTPEAGLSRRVNYWWRGETTGIV
ncbi:MAG: hypothetical protein M0Z94_03405 [Dehalococcoidales bacterium]|nr:hypothetical protein [Dehalococcoidales bacterium]